MRIGVVALVDDGRRPAGQIDLERRAAAGSGLEVGERERGEREIGADQHRRREHRQRIVHEMAPRPDLVGQLGAEDIRLDGRAAGMQRAFDEPRVRLLVLAEGDDAGDAGLLGAALEARELRVVAIDDRGTAGSETEKDLRLGVGDLGERAEEFEVHRRDRGDDGDVGRASRDSGLISPAWFIPISRTA